MTRYAMVMDQRRCIGCQSCTVACRTWNELPNDIIYNPVVTEGVQGVFPDVHQVFTPLICMHCDNPPCTICCHCNASQQEPDGIVWVDETKCMGCKVCVNSCPYGARDVNHKEGFVRKCTFCKDRVREGDQPYCVQTCHQKARIFGDLDDPQSEVSKLINSLKTERIFPELNTDPQIYYIPDLGGRK
jgi:Fe-S-cluster-containing dehydrogenase component